MNKKVLILIFLFQIVIMPAYSVPGYNPKTDSQPTYYDVSKEIAYLNKLKANFYKKYPDKKLKEYNNPVMGHVNKNT